MARKAQQLMRSGGLRIRKKMRKRPGFLARRRKQLKRIILPQE